MKLSPNFVPLSCIYLLQTFKCIQGVTGTPEQSQLVLTKGCACPGGTLTYECSIVGDQGGATIWFGSAFNCASNESVLFHNRFTDTGTLGECNNGAIVARSLSANGNIYTSQLNVTVTPDTAGKTIMCLHDPLTGQCQTQTNRRLSVPLSIVVPTGSYPPPYISTASFLSRQLTFSWSPVAPDCPAIHYNIQASNCGSCPNTTIYTNVTCTDVPTENSVCTFAIQTVACGSLMGDISDPIIIQTALQERNNADMSTNTAYLATISSLVVALITSVVVFTTAIVIILQRSKAKIKELQPPHREESSTHLESMYEDPLPSVSAISTKENVAYGHAKKSTAAM